MLKTVERELKILKKGTQTYISKDFLLDALDLQRDAPILSINLQDLHNRVSQIGWVKMSS